MTVIPMITIYGLPKRPQHKTVGITTNGKTSTYKNWNQVKNSFNLSYKSLNLAQLCFILGLISLSSFFDTAQPSNYNSAVL